MNSGEQNAKKKRETSIDVPFEFCEVCRINHGHGRKHKYLPNHVKALSRVLSRFQDKLSGVRFYIQNPSPLHPEHALLNRLWCVFCDLEIIELGSSFGCYNAIRHLASSGHLKRLKNFLWKHGGGMDRVSSFVVSEIDLLKWEKKCEASRIVHPSSGDASDRGPPPPEDIHNGLTHKNMIISEENFILCSENKISSGVQPLHSHTIDIRGSLLSNKVETSVCSSSSHTRTQEQGRVTEGGSASAHESCLDSVTSPPWLNENEGVELILGDKKTSTVGDSNRVEKSRKLNPNRVGAAWAEKRRIELEMEKRGLVVASDFSDDWLPNFGRVWQEGTRKDSRKEFEKEKFQFLDVDSQLPTALKPYISKRMKLEEKGDVSGGL
ncbi:coiled coil protein [Wolffia australiana]